MRIFELLEDEQRYYIASELVIGGELYDRILKMKYFTEAHASQIIKQILLALNYMHSLNIIHRDIKAENILMVGVKEDDLRIKMTDFGFACFFKPGEGKTEILGSPLYMAPEIIANEKPYNEKVDIWSVGVITFILLSGRPPFKGRARDEIF
jgi:calcium-dependent protein kinase